MKIRLAAPLQPDSTVDGEGIRTVVWTQGCPHNCKGCHNPITHSFEGGYLEEIEEVLDEIDSLQYQDGITLSGGDPFMQPDACLEIAKYAKEKGLNVWCYTGFTFEQLKALGKTKPAIIELLSNIDILVDGKFILEERNLDLKYCGSSNQRVIDVANSLKNGNVELVKKYMEDNEKIGFYKEKYLFV